MFYQIFGILFLILSNFINSNNDDKIKLNNSKVQKISVIIPMYNKEKYLNECWDIVIN